MNAKASTPESRNSISTWRSEMGFGCRISLIHPLFGNSAVVLVVYVGSVSSARGGSINEHAESHGSSSRCRSHDEMKIPGVKAVRDPPVSHVQHSGLFLHRPAT